MPGVPLPIIAVLSHCVNQLPVEVKTIEYLVLPDAMRDATVVQALPARPLQSSQHMVIGAVAVNEYLSHITLRIPGIIVRNSK